MKKLQINLNHIVANFSEVRSLIPKNCKVCATIKADAYGHGLLPVAQTLVAQQIDFLGITTLDEATALREAGITTPILLYLPLNENYSQILALDLVPFVGDQNYLNKLEEAARNAGKILKIHLKVDVGMGRYGCLPTDIFTLVDKVLASSFLRFDGLCAHLSESEETRNPVTTKAQLGRFEKIRQRLEDTNKLSPYVHIANSEGFINFPESHYNLVRIGGMLYGCSHSSRSPKLFLVMYLSTEIIFVKQVPAGTLVSYNSLYRTKEIFQLGIVPLGYSDGLDIHLANKGAKVYVNGQFYPLVGKVCMNIFLIEVPLNHTVKTGDIVQIVGEIAR